MEENQQSGIEIISFEKPKNEKLAAITIEDGPDSPRVEEFSELDLHEKLREAIESIGWTKPTPIQGLSLQTTLENKDLAGFAQTGTGKTGVFLITAANMLLKTPPKPGVVRSVVLAPTRELAIQIEEDARPIFQKVGIQSLAVYGGVDYGKQAKAIEAGIDVIVATPGRLKDYTEKKIVNLDQVDLFVCDEVDRMFDMGFIDDVEYFLEKIPENSQKLLFSATTNERVKELAFEYLENPRYVSANPEVITPEAIKQHAILCDTTNKLQVLLGLLQEHKPECAIIFANTKLTCEWLRYKLAGNNIEADLITGDLPQKKRIHLIKRIREGKVKALIATDVASRGLHISQVSHVYNFDIPQEAANYVHRIGRTARAGAKGASYSLVCDEYGENFEAITALLGDAVPKSEWFDEKYLEIKDQSGDPFVEGVITVSSPTSRGRDGKSSSRPSDSRPSKRDGKSRSGDRDGKSAKSGQRKPDRQGANQDRDSQQRRKRGQSQNKKRDRRPNRGKGNEQGREAREQIKQVAKTKQTEAPSSFTGVVKKFFGSLFGSKK